MSITEIKHIHRALVDKARENDRTAQGELYHLYYKAMYNSSLRIVGESFTAEDIMHDAFIDAFKSIHQFQWTSTFGAWLKRIVINKSINYLRRNQMIAEKLEDYSLYDESESVEAVPAGRQENGHSLEEVKRAMPLLSPQYKLVFSLYMIEGYDHEEIAQIMNISASTSRSQLSRAKVQLKKIISYKEYQAI